MTPLLLLALVTLLVWIVGGLEVALGSRTIDALREVPVPTGIPPAVSVVVAARNEEIGVRAGVTSLVAQRGIDHEVVAVDDRSDDRTGAILDELGAGDPRVRVVHVTELPAGWLGKTHALHAGAAAGRGEWLLFTDADVVLEEHAVARAVEYARTRGIDHLAVTPELTMPTLATDLFGGTFVLLFSRFARPWKARDPGSRAHIGIGAFNLVRRACYEAVGGHEGVRLRPDEDLMLGKLIKRGGWRQDVAYGTGEVRVRWYSSIGEAVRGLEKNAFAGMGYSLAAVLAACAALAILLLWPWVAVVVTGGAVRLLNAGAVATMVALYLSSARRSGARPWLAPGIPLGVLVFGYAVLRSAVLALARGEVRWRGTAHSLAELRAFRL